MVRRKTAYIYDRADWLAFRWDSDSIAAQLAAVRHHQGRLLGRMESLGFHSRMDTTLLTLTKSNSSLPPRRSVLEPPPSGRYL